MSAALPYLLLRCGELPHVEPVEVGLACLEAVDHVRVEVAAAAAEPHGLNAAGIAAAQVWSECIDHAIERGAELGTFSGLAGVGDLTATVRAPGGRNRRRGRSKP